VKTLQHILGWAQRPSADKAGANHVESESAGHGLAAQQEIATLAQIKSRYDGLMAATSDVVIVTDSDGRIVEANATAVESLGYEEPLLRGRLLTELAPVAGRGPLKSFMAGCLSGCPAGVDELVLTRSDGDRRWFAGRAALLPGEDRSILQVVLRDVTERRRQFILSEKEVSFIHELSRTLPLFQEFDQMLDRILSMLSQALSFNGFALVLAEPKEMIATICVGNKTKAAFLTEIRGRLTEILSELGDGANTSKVEYLIERKADIEPGDECIRSQILLPLAVVNGVAGLFSSKENAFSKEELSLFSTMVSGISSLYIAYRSYQQVQELSITDSLTGLYNRRKFFEEIEKEVERVSRYGSPLSVLMLDLDHFKPVNDKFGHQMGDEVLRALAGILRASTRKTDLVARYGGEEFIIMLTETPLKGALGVAQRIKAEVERAAVMGRGAELKFTVSLGLAPFIKGDTVDSLISRADGALYQAKKNGRNRVEIAETSGAISNPR
jgi:diguanylate cyclase (GGDEF)-like protein/PAS domain S-box-containing protein